MGNQLGNGPLRRPGAGQPSLPPKAPPLALSFSTVTTTIISVFRCARWLRAHRCRRLSGGLYGPRGKSRVWGRGRDGGDGGDGGRGYSCPRGLTGWSACLSPCFCSLTRCSSVAQPCPSCPAAFAWTSAVGRLLLCCAVHCAWVVAAGLLLTRVQAVGFGATLSAMARRQKDD